MTRCTDSQARWSASSVLAALAGVALSGLFGVACAIPDASCLSAADCAAGEVCRDLACVPVVEIGACGGVDGAATLGAPCGACGNGLLVCDAGEVRCLGGTANACGGCGPEPGRLGAGCGACGGAWMCEGAEMVCSARTNVCGGCASLTPAGAALGQVCEDAAGGVRAGVWLCETPDRIACRSPERNACGGTTALDGLPGTPCGPCLQGRLTCTDAETLACCYGDTGRCDAAAEPADACGGCAGLSVDAVGGACGVCGAGELALDCAAGRLVCRGDGGNACGGCAELAATPGQRCGVGEVYACVGPNELACLASTGANACGGDVELSAAPGEACGPCRDGRVVCVAPDQLGCVGATEPGACGACRGSSESPGEACGIGASWRCADEVLSDEPLLVCSPDAAFDVCGGTSQAPQQVWDACGECGGRWGCDGTSLACVVDPARAPRTQYRDQDGDGFGDRDDPGSAVCGGTEGFVEQTGDCDDSRADVRPGLPEVPGNGRDDDCDAATPD